MGFLKDQSKPETFYLEITEEGSNNRPLAAKPVSVWVHKIHSVVQAGPNNQLTTIRSFGFETCTATGRNGTGCFLCNTPDPLWHMLKDTERTNRQGKRVDFPKTPRHYLPVYNHLLNTVKLVEGGNQIFSEMDKWFDTQPPQNQDLRRCDWHISKTGKGMSTQYRTVRLDATTFSISPELQAEAEAVVKKAFEERRPTDPNKLMQMISGNFGVQDNQGAVVPSLPTTPVQAALPASTPAAPAFQAPAFTAPAYTPPTFQQVPQVAAPLPPPVAPPVAPVAVAAPVVVGVPSTPADQTVVTAFASWVAQQPEFSGMGAVTNLIPAVKAKAGTLEYSKLSAQQLGDLKTHLEAHLASLRAGKA